MACKYRDRRGVDHLIFTIEEPSGEHVMSISLDSRPLRVEGRYLMRGEEMWFLTPGEATQVPKVLSGATV
jgi:hypothetical protein